jgi:hypothetical protein
VQHRVHNAGKGCHLIQETIYVKERNSTQAKMGGLIVSVVQIHYQGARLVVGRPGLPNVESTFSTGGALLYETPDGLFEIRLMSTAAGDQVMVLLSQVSPRPGITGGFVDQDSNNAPFTPPELVRIAASLEQIRLAMSERPDVRPEQLDFIARKLDDMRAASERLGRKDWMNLALGTMTSVIITGAFTPNAGRAFSKPRKLLCPGSLAGA